MTTFDPVEAHRSLAETIYGRLGVTRHVDAYLATTSWTEFFAVDASNTELYLTLMTYDGEFTEAEPLILSYGLYPAVRYAVEGKMARWTDLETALLSTTTTAESPRTVVGLALIYAKAFFQNARWPAFETYLTTITDAPSAATGTYNYLMSHLSYDPSITVPTLHTLIMNNTSVVGVRAITDYFEQRQLSRDPTWETSLLQSSVLAGYPRRTDSAVKDVVDYALRVVRTRWPEFETAVATVNARLYPTTNKFNTIYTQPLYLPYTLAFMTPDEALMLKE